MNIKVGEFTVVQNDWIAMENPSNSMANKLLDNPVMVFICMVTSKRTPMLSFNPVKEISHSGKG